MKITHFFNLHRNINKYNYVIIFEIAVIFLLSILAAYFLVGGLDFMESDKFNFLYIIVLIISLFYGIVAGIVIDIMYIIFAYFYFDKFPFYFSLNSLMIVIVGGEFNFYWKLKIFYLDNKIDYLESKLREIGRASLFTKLSHDFLEESYLSKPYTLRSVVLDVVKNDNIDDFLLFLSKKFNIKKFAYIENKNVYPFKMDKNIDFNDRVIKKMYEKDDITYIKDVKNSKYLASIPIFNLKDELKAYIVIEEIPFIYFNEENLMAIQLSSNYFYIKKEDYKFIKKIKDSSLCKYISCETLKEFSLLYILYKKTNAKSSVILLDVEREYAETVANFLTKSLRMLDFYERISLKEREVFLICLPLTNKIGAGYFLERIFNTLKFIDRNKQFNILSIENYKSLGKILNG